MKVYDSTSGSESDLPEWITFIEEDDSYVNYIMLRSNNLFHKGEWQLRIIATLEDADG